MIAHAWEETVLGPTGPFTKRVSASLCGHHWLQVQRSRGYIKEINSWGTKAPCKFCEFDNWYRLHPSESSGGTGGEEADTLLPHPSEYGVPHPEWRVEQFESVRWILDTPSAFKVLEAPTGCHAPGQGILMADGSIRVVDNIAVGDLLMGDDSSPRRVISLITGYGPMYRVLPIKGRPLDINLGHVLTLVRTNTSSRGERVREDCLDGEIVDVSLSDWFGWSKYRKHIYKLFRAPVREFASQTYGLPISPHFLGVLLGDAYMPNVAVTTPEKELVSEIYEQARVWGFSPRVDTSNDRCPSYYLTYGRGKSNPLRERLRELGLVDCKSDTKFVPMLYKTSTWGHRLELLAGLIDTDGSYNKNGCFDYISKSQQLSEDVVFLCRSVGLQATIQKCWKYSQSGAGGWYWRVCISGGLDIIPCRVPRKKAAPREQKKHPLRTGFCVEPLGEGCFFGFELDGNGRYLLDNFVVTHNSGKSAVARAVSSNSKVVALTQTKSLQDQYGSIYSADVLKGRANYDCAHPKATRDAKCDECLFSDKGMGKCPYRNNCPYMQAKYAALASDFAVLNYAYWLYSQAFKDSHKGTLFLDECHLVPDLVIDRAGTVTSERRRQQWGLPPFPVAQDTSGSALHRAINDPMVPIRKWLNESVILLREAYEQLDFLGLTDPSVRKKARQCEYLGRSFVATLSAMNHTVDDWYCQSNPGKALIIKPLTARHHFKYFFAGPERKIALMSATVGNFEAFADELGLGTAWESRRVPGAWEPERRPVYALPDAPRMSYKSGHSDYEHQADLIAQCIKICPEDWCGIVHVTRKKEARLLAGRLARRGLQDRMWTPPEDGGTSYQLQSWELQKQLCPNSIMVAWQFHEGFDGLDERICISGKVPFPDLSDPYEHQRMEYSHRMYSQRAALGLQQEQGRIRRGREQDYDTPTERRGLNVIADRNWSRVKKFLSEDFKDSLVEEMPQ